MAPVCISKTVIVAISALSLIGLASAVPRVDITINPPVHPKFGQRMRVTCVVTGITDADYFNFKVKFLCPVVSTNARSNVPCFQNCKPTCSPGMGCTTRQASLLGDISCSSFKGKDRLQFDFEYPYKDDEFAGDYLCQYFGKESARVSIPKPIRPPTLPPKTTKSPPRAPPTKPSGGVAPTKPVAVKTEKPRPTFNIVTIDPCANRPTVEPVVDVHRERILVVVMVLLFVSLAVNIIVIVRCTVKIHYAKYPHKKRMSSILCLQADVARPPSAVPHPPTHYAASLGLADDAGGSDSTYSMPNSAFVPVSGHGRANTLPVITSSDSQNIVFIPVIANSLNPLQSASHPRLNSPLPDNMSLGGPTSGAAGAGRRQEPPVPARDARRLSTSSIQLRLKAAHNASGSQPLNGAVVEAEFDPEQETLID